MYFKICLKYSSIFFVAYISIIKCAAQQFTDTVHPSMTEVIKPIHKDDFNNKNTCPERKQGGNPKMVEGFQVFNGSMDGNRQVDPQIAVGGGYVLEASNGGLIIYNKKGEFIEGVSQKCFNNGIDPKLVYDIHNKVFIFDYWWYYDKEKNKPVNIAVSEQSDPRGAWNIYPISRKEEEDGGGIGYSKKWIGYSYPGGEDNTFILKTAEAKAGKPVTIYHFKGSLGEPVFMQDPINDLYFFAIDDSTFVIRKVSEDANGIPFSQVLVRKKHDLKYIDYPPSSPQKGTQQKVASGDRNPKNLVFENGCIWFSQAVNCNGRSAVQWLQIRAFDGKIIQKGLISSDTSNFIQTTIAVNKRNDVLIGFQETNEHSFISPRFTYRLAKDPKNKTRKIFHFGEGRGATDGESWGDYSGSTVDGDNLSDLWTIQSIANEKGKNESIILKMLVKF